MQSGSGQKKSGSGQKNSGSGQKNSGYGQKNSGYGRMSSGGQKSGGRRKKGGSLPERKARDAQSALEALARERTQLLHAAAAVEPVANREDWQAWRDRAEAAMAEAGTVAEDAALDSGTRKALAASAEELARGIAIDREASALCRGWDEYFAQSGRVGIHPFHTPESEALANRTAALEKRVAQPLEMPATIRMGLENYRKRAEEWSRIRECRDELARLAWRPEPGSEEWLRDARLTTRAAAAILNDGTMGGRAHGAERDPHGREVREQRRRARPVRRSETPRLLRPRHAGSIGGAPRSGTVTSGSTSAIIENRVSGTNVHLRHDR